ncbi:MAM and LDL-receptor class A domain-containing protein 1 [Lingula anatina]|uniref:MAM and LDL-receptor class A domain-containing protein 1 n=1 Tax=Lingula anatina TaxID=7574 RepID=A0A1S3I5U0_LINAN|nr:MAM and LDL-receptor class A domain-containing protein 1 [Lingula anatina]|eukprot:XP_013393211.1 MAM and LDL-receptor class A domain-containing protein 1 [Lingula anatina]
MYGQHIGTLNVYSKRGNDLGYPIWTKSADQGNAWNIARVTVNARTPFQVVFEAIRGTNYAGDIAIDDFKLSNGACATPGSCDFETDTCTWSNGASDDFDWIRRQGVTPSQGTGPSVDHTKGTAAGYYVFIEASSPRRPGDRAVFSSQSFNPHANARCLRFWFHMLGNHVGTLRVSLSVNGLDSSLWQLSGNQSNSWKQASVPIAPQKSAYKVTIEGIVGQGFQGDIALDDIQISYRTCRLQPGKATPSTATTVTVPTKTTPTTPSTGSATTTPSAATVNCNFDNGFCGWTHSTKDNFDWLRNRGATSSRNTGPTQDHTGNGYYIYIEASGKTQNKTSMIETPQVPASTTGHCLRFWYHMYGDQIGTLNVYMKNRPNLGRPLFTKSGSLGNKWIQANVTLISRNRAFTVVFEGLIGTGYRGDIALDDVTVSTGNCQSTTPASSRSCDFEDAKICGYTQDKTGDQFDWTRASGATSSGNTGPSNDHTYGTPQGEYMYIEVSAPRKVNDIARLTSPKYKDNQAMCLQFYYHMYGQDIGTLNVFAKVNQALGSAVFSMKGDQGNKWQVGQATIPAAAARRGYQLVFEGIRGSNYRGDIAIDDISMTKGACANPGACDFETGLCTWTNVQAGDQFDWTQGNGGTSSSGTGPTIDHTLGTAAGKYMYIEASNPRVRGDTALLISQSFPPASGPRCVTFWVHMYGANIGTLNVKLRQGSSNTIIWTMNSNNGDKWISAQAPFTSSQVHSIVFEGIRGTGFQGDIAIDDVGFSDSNCGLVPAAATPPPQTTITTTTPSKVSTTTPVPGAFTCNFEKDFCGWTQDTKDQFDWTRQNGPTSSTNTGPSTDHTMGTGAGFYVYIEASPVAPGNKARLVSPIVQYSGSVQCLTFWYHMYGQHVDTLNVYVQTRLNLGSPVWSKNTTQGNVWRRAQVDVNAKVAFNIVFEGVSGIGYAGDISLDDIDIKPGYCQQGSTATPGGTRAPATVCDFENPTVCGFSQVTTGDQFDWTRAKGKTSSGGTGPNTDHTYNTDQGYYMYVEASSPRKNGDKAQLVSPVYSTTTQYQCLQFWYHMFGRNIGTLNVYLKVGAVTAKIWSETGDQGNKWYIASASIPPQNRLFQVVFEGVRGTGYQGDIAIDDYAIKSGACPVPGNCDFEVDTCTWTNVGSGDKFDWTLSSGSTSSGGTGPSVDHTVGSAAGKYVYIESSRPRVQGDNAMLQSEVLNGSSQCLHFWYHMYGVNIGLLRVWIKYPTGTPKPLWEKTGNIGQAWQEGRVSIQNPGGPYQVIFEGVCGNGYQGDIAIDDISFDKVSPCNLLPSDATPTVTQAPTTASTTPTTTTTTTPTTITTTLSGSATTPTTTLAAQTGIDCNFDVSLCGWSQDTNDQFDWTRQKGSTSSQNTGPSQDHTSRAGFYVYIETSGRKNGDKARLTSPGLQVLGNQYKCLSFWYHMYGAHVNSLNVYFKSGTTLGKAIWTKKGTQGNKWIQAQVDISGTASGRNLQVVFEGVRGTGYQGDISIDDVTVVDGTCAAVTPTTPPPGVTIGTVTPPSLVSCNFQTGLCGYTQDTSDQFDWTRSNGATSSQGTGPSVDHTYGTPNGYYVFIETSSPRVPNDKARLISPMIRGAGRQCLKFWYHMFGGDVGTFNVYMKSGTNLGQPVWSSSYDQGDVWKVAQVQLNQRSSYQIVFEGIRDKGYRGDIALDDIITTPGNCPPEGSCNFDNGMCTYSNVQDGSDDFDWVIKKNNRPAGNPRTDHTTSAAAGGMMYISARKPRNNGDRARVMSQLFSPTGSSPKCFKFWWYLYNTNAGTLRAIVKSNGTSTTVWEMTASGNNRWRYGAFPVQSQSSYVIILEGVVGSGSGDIALDDTSLSTQGCGISPAGARPSSFTTTPTPATTTVTVPPSTAPNSFNCSFEYGLCGWKQLQNDQFDWTRVKGSTSSTLTGPANDHTTGSKYVYIESSRPRVQGDNAMLQSEVLNGSSQCLHFWYHMYGVNIGLLRVWIKYPTGTPKPLWEKTGNIGQAWQEGRVSIQNPGGPYQVIFEGVCGNGYQGDIAIDDISFDKVSPCNLLPSDATPTVTQAPTTASTTPTTTTTTTPTTITTTLSGSATTPTTTLAAQTGLKKHATNCFDPCDYCVNHQTTKIVSFGPK